MRRSLVLLAGTALLSVAASGASADCRQEIASLSPGTTTGPASGMSDAAPGQRIAKDGSTAPLQTGASGSGSSGPATTGSTAQGQASGQGGIAKDGSTMPLATSPGGGNTNVATSQQDAQSQQKGGQTAAQAQASGAGASGTHSPQMMAALDRARTMLQQGNEAGCMQAVDEAKRMRP
jgi:hypothetical protein